MAFGRCDATTGMNSLVNSGSNDCPIRDARRQGRKRCLGHEIIARRSPHVCLSRVFTSVC